MEGYDPLVFDRISDVHVAAAAVKENNGEEIIRSSLKGLLQDYAVNDHLGVALVHRHFDLKPDEVMVDYRGVATPWNKALLDNYQAYGSILPLSWVLIDGKPCPYEFYFTTDPDDHEHELPPGFLSKYNATLKSQGLDGFLGIRALKKAAGEEKLGTMEFTQRYATFVVPYDGKSDYKPKGAVYRTCWSFSHGKEDPADWCDCCAHCAHCGHCGHCYHWD
jgi:hypothetical protein